MSYVFVESENPSIMAPRPYRAGVLPAELQTPGSAMTPAPSAGLGLTEDQQKTLKTALVIAGVLLLGWWLFFSKSSPLKRNPGRGKNRVVKLSGSSESGWYWRLLRRGSKRHGPFATQEQAVDDAEGYGYRVLE